MITDGIDQDCDGEDLSYFIDSDSTFTCAITAEQDLKCWGDNDYEQLNIPSGSFQFVTTGAYHGCTWIWIGKFNAGAMTPMQEQFHH